MPHGHRIPKYVAICCLCCVVLVLFHKTIPFPFSAVIMWAMLLGDSPNSFNWIDYCGQDKQLLKSCASILDAPNAADLMMYFESSRALYDVSKQDITSTAASLGLILVIIIIIILNL